MTDSATYHKIETEADASSDAGHEDGLLSESHTAARRSLFVGDWKRWIRPLCEALLVLTIAFLGFRLALESRRLQPRGTNEPRKEFGFVDKVFMNDTRFANEGAFMTKEGLYDTLHEWLSLSSKGRGYVGVLEAERDGFDGPPYDINPLRKHYTKEAYMMSGMHQLHCLSTIMHSYGRMRLGQDEADNGYHIAHCFDYIRQGIMCAGDITLEGNNSVRHPGVDIPWGTAHRCANWDAIRDWADERTQVVFPDYMGIL